MTQEREYVERWIFLARTEATTTGALSIGDIVVPYSPDGVRTGTRERVDNITRNGWITLAKERAECGNWEETGEARKIRPAKGTACRRVTDGGAWLAARWSPSFADVASLPDARVWTVVETAERQRYGDPVASYLDSATRRGAVVEWQGKDTGGDRHRVAARSDVADGVAEDMTGLAAHATVSDGDQVAAWPPRTADGAPVCGCEHTAHFVDEFGPQTGHAYQGVAAGGKSHPAVGPVCDGCAETCLAGYALTDGDQGEASAEATPAEAVEPSGVNRCVRPGGAHLYTVQRAEDASGLLYAGDLRFAAVDTLLAALNDRADTRLVWLSAECVSGHWCSTESDAATAEAVAQAEHDAHMRTPGGVCAPSCPEHKPPVSDPAVHRFDSTEDAYTATQTRDDIRDGDVLVIPSERVAGFLLKAWPVAVTAQRGGLHGTTDGADPAEIEGGRYVASVDVARRIARDEFGTDNDGQAARQTGESIMTDTRTDTPAEAGTAVSVDAGGPSDAPVTGVSFHVSPGLLADALAFLVKDLGPVHLAERAGVLVETADDGGRSVILSTYDGETLRRVTLPATVEMNGRAVFPGVRWEAMAAQLAKSKTGPGGVSVDATDDGATLRFGTSVFTLPMLPLADALARPAVPATVGTVDARALAAAIADVAPAASRDQTRPAYAGVHITADGARLALTTTDMYRAGLHDVPWNTSGMGFTALLPAKALAAMAKRMAKGGDAPASIGHDGTGVAFTYGQAGYIRTFYIRSLDVGGFPDVRGRVFPAAFIGHATVDAKALTTALALVRPACDPKKLIVRLAFTAAALTVQAGTEYGDGAGGEVPVPGTFDGPDGTVTGIDPDYLIAALKGAGSGRVRLSIGRPDVKVTPVGTVGKAKPPNVTVTAKPMVVRPVDADGADVESRCTVVMPARVPGDVADAARKAAEAAHAPAEAGTAGSVDAGTPETAAAPTVEDATPPVEATPAPTAEDADALAERARVHAQAGEYGDALALLAEGARIMPDHRVGPRQHTWATLAAAVQTLADKAAAEASTADVADTPAAWWVSRETGERVSATRDDILSGRVVRMGKVEPHRYAPSMMESDPAARARCRVCSAGQRTTIHDPHAGEIAPDVADTPAEAATAARVDAGTPDAGMVAPSGTVPERGGVTSAAPVVVAETRRVDLTGPTPTVSGPTPVEVSPRGPLTLSFSRTEGAVLHGASGDKWATAIMGRNGQRWQFSRRIGADGAWYIRGSRGQAHAEVAGRFDAAAAVLRAGGYTVTVTVDDSEPVEAAAPVSAPPAPVAPVSAPPAVAPVSAPPAAPGGPAADPVTELASLLATGDAAIIAAALTAARAATMSAGAVSAAAAVAPVSAPPVAPFAAPVVPAPGVPGPGGRTYETDGAARTGVNKAIRRALFRAGLGIRPWVECNGRAHVVTVELNGADPAATWAEVDRIAAEVLSSCGVTLVKVA